MKYTARGKTFAVRQDKGTIYKCVIAITTITAVVVTTTETAAVAGAAADF